MTFFIEHYGEIDAKTYDKICHFEALLKKWQSSHNLVGSSTLNDFWVRHVADSAQIAQRIKLIKNKDLDKKPLLCVDFGSGAGFPALIIAMLLGEEINHIHCFESVRKKCAFMQTVSRETFLPVTVHNMRIERFDFSSLNPVDFVTARAFAPLNQLLNHACPLLHQGAIGLFHKGRDLQKEIDHCGDLSSYTLDKFANAVTEDSFILQVQALRA